MTNRIIATAAAAAIALTAVFSAPARALDAGELGRLILGTGAVLMLGAALNEQKHKRNRVTRVPVNRTPVRTVPAWCVFGNGQQRYVDWQCVRNSGY